MSRSQGNHVQWPDALVQRFPGHVWVDAMPIYMDVHRDLGEVTEDDIRAAHERDLEVQGDHGGRFPTFWFNQPDGHAFCLVEAPDKESAIACHKASHGRSTAASSRDGDDRVLEIIERHDPIVRNALAASGGREVKHTGDGILAGGSESGSAQANRSTATGISTAPSSASQPASAAMRNPARSSSRPP